MRLYYHKTSGGAEYLMDTFIEVTEGEHKGHREGVINNDTKYIVRIDGDITKDAELNVREAKTQLEQLSLETEEDVTEGNEFIHMKLRAGGQLVADLEFSLFNDVEHDGCEENEWLLKSYSVYDEMSDPSIMMQGNVKPIKK